MVVGLIFIAHGSQKLLGQGLGGVVGTTEGLGIPASAESAVALVLVELVGGAALILGFFTRLFAVPLTFTWQLYFDDALTDEVQSQGPYAEKGQRDVRNSEDGIFRGGGDELLLDLRENGRGYAATFDIALDTTYA